MKIQNIFKAAAVVAIVASLAMNAYLFTQVKEVKETNEHQGDLLRDVIELQGDILGEVIVLKMFTGISNLDEDKEASEGKEALGHEE